MPAYVFFFIVFLADGSVVPNSGPAASPAECADMEACVHSQVQEHNKSAANPAVGVTAACSKVQSVKTV